MNAAVRMMPTAPEKRVPSNVLRMILEGIQEVSGSQFGKVLERAGLNRYANEMPAADTSPTITEPELSRLYGSTFAIAGESLTRQFLMNYGRRLPEALLASPDGQHMVAEAAKVPQADRLRAAVRLIAETGSKIWVGMSWSEDAEYFYLEVPGCAICADIRGARTPICANSEIVYTTLARALSGVRVTALEVECAATGHEKCKYRIRK